MMTSEKERLCRTCRSLGETKAARGGIEFECRRNPPVVPHPRASESHRWPYIFPDQDWCDGWQEAPVVNPFGEPSVVNSSADTDDEYDDNDEDDGPDWSEKSDTGA